MQNRAEAASYQIPIRALLLRPQEKKTVSVTLDADTVHAYGIACQELPHAEGVLENRAGVLMLQYAVKCVPECTCDRCLSPVSLQIEETFSHVIVTETVSDENDAEYLLAPDAMLDMAETVMEDLRLSLPTRILCRPDCRGLCPLCGKNLNEGDCGCKREDSAVTIELA